MNKPFFLSVCLVLAIAATSLTLAYLPLVDAPYAKVSQQSQWADTGAAVSPGDGTKPSYVPMCTLDSSLRGRGQNLTGEGADDDSTPSGTAEHRSPLGDVEIGTYRCQA